MLHLFLRSTLVSIIFMLSFCPLKLSAQDYEKLSADSLYVLAKEAYRLGKYLEAANLNEFAAMKIRSQTPLDEDFLRKVIGNLGVCAYNAGDNIRSVGAYREAYELGTKLLGETDIRVIRYRSGLSGALINLRQYEEAVFLMHELEDTLSAEIKKGQPFTNMQQGNLNNLAVAYMEMGNYDRAEDLFLSVKKIREEKKEVYALGLVHYNLGDLHRRAGRLRQSLYHYSLAKAKWGELKVDEKPDRIFVHLLIRIAATEALLNNVVKAEEQLELARKRLANAEFSHAEKSAFLNNISTAYFFFFVTLKAIDAAKDGLDKDVENTKDLVQLSILHSLVQHYTEVGDLPTAEKYYDLGRGVLELDRVSAFKTIIASAYQRTTFLLRSKKFKEVLSVIEDLDEKTNWQELVSAKGKLSMSRPAHLTGLMTNLAIAKVAISRQLAARKDQIVGLEESLGLLKKMDDYLSALQFSDALEEDVDWTKAFVGENYGAAVEFCHELYQLTQDESYLDQAFYYAERTKYWAVFQQWSERAAYGTESEWRREERSLRLRIFKLEQTIQASALGTNTLLLADLNKSKSVLGTRLYAIRDSIRRNDGGRNSTWLTQDLASLSSIKNSLEKNETLLSFFADSHSYWLFTITKEKTELSLLPPEFAQQAKAFSQSISSPFLKGKDPEKEELTISLRQYQQSGRWLMQAIFPQGLNQVDQGRLIIVPAGETEAIPFAALPVTDIADLYRLKDYPYLMREVAITYGYSATLWQSASQSKGAITDKAPRLKALAPFEFGENKKPTFYEPFGESEAYNFKPLKNRVALTAIAEQIDADVYTFPLAMKEEVFTKIKDYSILYLTTHSLLGGNDGGPFMAFTRADTFSRGDFLYAREILQYDLPLDLVVLSSCASLSGNYVAGEGTYSLSRSFAYAGSRSVVATIWPIDDSSSAEMNSYFFKELKNGKSKDEALREAQLQMLNKKVQTRNHPYFWAAFTHYGNWKALW